MTIDRKALFAMAWNIARQDQWSRRLPSVRGLFGEALRKAWAEMKRREELAQKSAATDFQADADLQAQIRDLENRDTLGVDGLARLSALRVAFAEATESEADRKPASIKAATLPVATKPRPVFTASENLRRLARPSAAAITASRRI
ncbi:hypothetical protein [Leisingera daeponensis]|uniref:hypothetical protein n=1 Tax=Leisingera daeponensis TaxID=405746 RepID=UPI001C9583CB|nr:hypothetical protein [Leisingera daeponensis]MBY6056352.1 hypothetical protein [Leisingera daeponensis]